MRPVIGGCVALAGMALVGCAHTSSPSVGQPSAPPPLSVGGGLGSQHGNYDTRAVGETRGANGERCTLYQWDRPISDTHAVRYLSASCPSAGYPGRFAATQLSREIIPLSESDLVR